MGSQGKSYASSFLCSSSICKCSLTFSCPVYKTSPVKTASFNVMAGCFSTLKQDFGNTFQRQLRRFPTKPASISLIRYSFLSMVTASPIEVGFLFYPPYFSLFPSESRLLVSPLLILKKPPVIRNFFCPIYVIYSSPSPVFSTNFSPALALFYSPYNIQCLVLLRKIKSILISFPQYISHWRSHVKNQLLIFIVPDFL